MNAESVRRLFGGRVAVGLSALVGIFAISTGVAHVGLTEAPALVVDVVPRSVRRVAGFAGAIVGFLLLASALELRRGTRIAWYATVGLLFSAAVTGVLQSSGVSLPTVALAVVALAVVIANRERFDRELSLSSTQLAALAALVGAQAYGTIGAFALREGFDGVETLTDAFYFAIVTASTVGYGDATATTPGARLFAVSVVVIGTASFALALGSLLGPAIEARLTSALGTMTDTELELIEDHVIVLGYGELTEPVLDELAETAPFVVITRKSPPPSELRERDLNVLVGDPSDVGPLERAGIDRAQAVVAATENDAEDALSILTARELNADIRIVAAATDRENVAKLKRAGADTVISPATIGGHLLVRSALGDRGMEALAEKLLDTSDENAPPP